MGLKVNTVKQQTDYTDGQQRVTLRRPRARVNGGRGGKNGICLISWERQVADVPFATGRADLG